jgi:hypothetical protein
MTTAWRARLCTCFLGASFAAACGGANSSEEPRIEIGSLKSSYCTGDSLQVTVRNLGQHAISINVAIQTYQGGKWVETWASLGTPSHEMPTKIAKTDLVQAGKSKTYSFDILGLPIRADLAGSRHRLRADGILDSRRSSVTSSEFAVCSQK